MKERISFVHPQGADVDTKSLTIKKAELRGPTVETTRQDRLTAILEELPTELATFLKSYRELHIRWTSPFSYDLLEPFASRLSPGLHISQIPANPEIHDPYKLCGHLQIFGPLDCMSAEAFTTHSEGKSSRTDAAFFYQEMEDITEFIRWISKEVCNSDTVCQSRAQDLSRASSLDISWDSAVDTLRISSHVPLSQQEIAATGSSKRRTEVGVLSKDVPLKPQPHEIALSGALSVLGESKEPSATLFSFPARHRLSDSSFSADFVQPAGLHPALRLALSSSMPPTEGSKCSPFAYFTFPKTIFADRYQFADELFLASKNLTASRYTTLPVDLEAPVYTTATWGSNVLLELAPPSAEAEEWTVEVPLHLRYLRPTTSGKMDIEIPYPAVFWACEAETGTDFSVNPFDRTHVGYDALFADVVYWHMKPQPVRGNRIMSAISVPVLKEQASQWVQQGTAAAVAVGFIWVLWKLFGTFATPRPENGKEKARQTRSSRRKTK